jgi:hypothetical protein
MDAQEEFAAEQRAVVRAQQLAREEQAEVRADQARLADAAARRDAAWDSARRTGRPVPTHDGVLARAREAFDAEDGRDAATAYGPQAPAVWWTRADGSPVEVGARPPAGVQRSVSDIETDALLARARELSASMAVEVARFHARRSAAGRAREDEASRASGYGYGYGPEIVR